MKSDAFYSGITGDTRKIRFRKYIGKSGRIWLMGICTNPRNELYVSSSEGDIGGYGGGTLKFQLEDGSIISLRGPWHSNPTAFTRDTGIEL